MTERVAIWGSGSQAMLYFRLAAEQGLAPIVIDPQRASAPHWIDPDHFFGASASLKTTLQLAGRYIVAIGGEHGGPRRDVSRALEAAGLGPISLVDSSADIKPTASIGEGTYVAQRVVVNHDCVIGADTILNTAATIDHECRIGEGVHLMGAAALAGRVRIDDFAVVGTNATILPDLHIGRGAYIGAGATVTTDIPDLAVAVGVPARVVRSREIGQDPLSERLIREARPPQP